MTSLKLRDAQQVVDVVHSGVPEVVTVRGTEGLALTLYPGANGAPDCINLQVAGLETVLLGVRVAIEDGGRCLTISTDATDLWIPIRGF